MFLFLWLHINITVLLRLADVFGSNVRWLLLPLLAMLLLRDTNDRSHTNRGSIPIVWPSLCPGPHTLLFVSPFLYGAAERYWATSSSSSLSSSCDFRMHHRLWFIDDSGSLRFDLGRYRIGLESIYSSSDICRAVRMETVLAQTKPKQPTNKKKNRTDCSCRHNCVMNGQRQWGYGNGKCGRTVFTLCCGPRAQAMRQMQGIKAVIVVVVGVDVVIST